MRQSGISPYEYVSARGELVDDLSATAVTGDV
jgi:hypothetical protein